MSFSAETKNEIKNKYFTSKKRHSKITGYRGNLQDREYLMELFIEKGTMSDPEKFYHLEFVCDSEEEALSVKNIIAGFSINCGLMRRKEHYVVYLKDSEAISDMLSLLGAHNAVLDFENIKVLKEMRESVQRRVNCETANISKTVSAALKQAEDIRYISERIGLDALSDSLREAAELRLKFPDAALSELAEHMPGVGRSGINHRFRKIAAIAEKLRLKEDERDPVTQGEGKYDKS